MSGQTRSLLMGILNVTPDSFSDAQQYLEPAQALAHAWTLTQDGADIIDIGAESSRPGAYPVDADLEWRRLEPVLARIAADKLPARISIDTYRSATMRRALDYPIEIINDIRGGADAATLKLLADRGLTYLAMHMHSNPLDMQLQPLDGQLAVETVAKFYRATQHRLEMAGFPVARIWLDPGIGFGKTDRGNLLLLRQALVETTQHSIVLGISRKSFIGRLLGIENPKERDQASKMLELSFLFAGIKVIRTHEVARLRMFRDMLS